MSGISPTSTIRVLLENLRQSKRPVPLLRLCRKRPRSSTQLLSRSYSTTLYRRLQPSSAAQPLGDTSRFVKVGGSAKPSPPSQTFKPPFKTSAVIDEAINARKVMLVGYDVEGKAVVQQQSMLLQKILQGIDRETQHVMQLMAADEDDPASLPTVRIVDREMLKKKERDTEARQKEQRKKEKLLEPKRLEVTWSIAPSDLGHYLRRLEKFLSDGRRVEFMFGMKRRSKPKAPEECHAIVNRVKSFVSEEVNGVQEYKKAEGMVGKTFTLFFQGIAMEQKAEKEV